jgi:D-arabinose 1-dehydrogenase-like Zn-dependent alcohol dehydrogenase
MTASADFLKNPLSLFDIRGKVAIVTGASGAFGALAVQVLAGAGAKVAAVAGNAEALERTVSSARALGAEVFAIKARPIDEPTSSPERSRLLAASTFSSSRRARTMSPRSSTWRPNDFSMSWTPTSPSPG